jgi:uncharacterized metal-binding protein
VSKKKVWIVPCSGIGKTYGSVARESAFIVTEDHRPVSAEIMPLALLVPEDSEARERIKKSKSITIDGCKLACAAKVVAETGGTVAHALQVLDVFREHRDMKPAGIVELNEGGKKLAAVLAERVSALVDEIGKERRDA